MRLWKQATQHDDYIVVEIGTN